MRHAIAGNRLGRNSSLRKATVRDLAKATIIHQRITTTKAKAKEASKLIDQLITLAKKGTLSHKRKAFAILCDHQLVSRLFNEVAARFMLRKGGYTRIIHLAENRRGDNAQMVFLELTEKDEKALQAKKAKAEKRKSKPKEKTEEGPGEVVEEKKPSAEKMHAKKRLPDAEQGKPEKKGMSGIKKIFQRKVGGE